MDLIINIKLDQGQFHPKLETPKTDLSLPGIIQSRNLRSRYEARNRFQEPSLELSRKSTWAGGPERQPYAYLIPSLYKRDLSYRHWSSAVGGEHSRKEPFEQRIQELFGTYKNSRLF